MTTIAYKDGIIAYDSQETQGTHIADINKDKHKCSKGVHFFISGETQSEELLIDAFLNNCIGAKDANASALVWDGETLWECGFSDDNGFWKVTRKSELCNAIGSGSAYSIGAMKAGATAKESVKIAASSDTGTGGRIRTFKIKEKL